MRTTLYLLILSIGMFVLLIMLTGCASDDPERQRVQAEGEFAADCKLHSPNRGLPPGPSCAVSASR